MKENLIKIKKKIEKLSFKNTFEIDKILIE